jgi:hypothetical protein
MFKYNCGRKQESSVWKYFIYDASTDKSTCTASDCNVALTGKSATNMKTRLNSEHKDIAAELNALEKETKDKICGELTSGKRNRLTKNLETRAFLKINRKYYD